MNVNPELRASDADRDSVAEVLHTAYAEGRIDADEHAERIDAALGAKTFGELIPLTADLGVRQAAQPVSSGGSGIVDSRDASDEPDVLTAVLSDSKRVGPWRVRRVNRINSLLGSVKLDMTEATFEAREVEITGTQFLGGLTIRVPIGTTIRDETANVMGNVSIKDIGESDPALPVIVLKVTNVLGDIQVKGPRRTSWSRKAVR